MRFHNRTSVLRWGRRDKPPRLGNWSGNQVEGLTRISPLFFISIPAKPPRRLWIELLIW